GSPFLFDKKMADYLDGLYQGVNEHFNSEMKLEIQGETMGFEEKRALKHQVFAGRHWLGQQNKQLRLARASSSSSARSPASNTTFLPDGRLDRPSRLPRMPGALCASRRHRGPARRRPLEFVRASRRLYGREHRLGRPRESGAHDQTRLPARLRLCGRCARAPCRLFHGGVPSKVSIGLASTWV